MKSLDQWFVAYGESHQNRQNRIIHKICVPLIFFSVVGMLWLLPLQLGDIRLGDLVMAAALVWYLFLGWRAFVVMLAEVIISYIALAALRQIVDPLPVLIGIFVLAWIGQFIGHKIEGKKPSFIEDLQFLLIGPLWIVGGLLPISPKSSEKN